MMLIKQSVRKLINNATKAWTIGLLLACRFVPLPETPLPPTPELPGITPPTSVLTPSIPTQQTPGPTVDQATEKPAFPLLGSVLIEDGRCCAGGIAGSKIDLKVTFSASSSFGAVTEMRVRQGSFCAKETELTEFPWEAFATQKTFQVTLFINWVGFFISVQFRDAQGNLSPIYCDDISLEGMPGYTPAPP